MEKEAKDFLVVPLDVSSTEEALIIVEELGKMVNFYKVGLELFTREGPTVVDILKKNCSSVSLKRFDQTEGGILEAAFLADFDSFESLEKIKEELNKLSKSITITYLDKEGFY